MFQDFLSLRDVAEVARAYPLMAQACATMMMLLLMATRHSVR